MGEVWGWDTSHYDDPPTTRDGIDLFTHKIAEGHHFYQDMEYESSITKALALGYPYKGSYFVNHGGTVQDQVDWWFELLERYSPWWKDEPYWTFQIDAEKFRYMDRAPTIAEINAMGDLIYNRSGLPAGRILPYAPRWLYGDSIRNLKYKNYWASNYGSNPVGPYRSVYPGDTSSRWHAEDLILQYGSNTIIAGQTTCDANGIRVSRTVFEEKLGAIDMPLTQADLDAIFDAVWTTKKQMVTAAGSYSSAGSQVVTVNAAVAIRQDDLPALSAKIDALEEKMNKVILMITNMPSSSGATKQDVKELLKKSLTDGSNAL